MSIATEITRLQSAKSAIKTAIEGKGVTVPDGTLLDGMAALIESIEAGGGTGAGDLFYTEITPATSGEVLTFEVGEIGERIAALIVSLKTDAFIEIGKNYGISCIASANQRPVSSDPRVVNVLAYKSGPSIYQSHDSSAQLRGNTPDGTYIFNSYNIWNSEYDKALVKLYVTNGAESKYGLLVGKTYDIWVIKD